MKIFLAKIVKYDRLYIERKKKVKERKENMKGNKRK